MSQALAPRHQRLSTYDKELLAVLMATGKWRHYLEVGQFIIRIDHENLKFLAYQKLNTNLQRKGMAKLMGLDFVIQYRKGRENVATNALSRHHEEGHCVVLESPRVLRSLNQEQKNEDQGSSWETGLDHGLIYQDKT